MAHLNVAPLSSACASPDGICHDRLARLGPAATAIPPDAKTEEGVGRVSGSSRAECPRACKADRTGVDGRPYGDVPVAPRTVRASMRIEEAVFTLPPNSRSFAVDSNPDRDLGWTKGTPISPRRSGARWRAPRSRSYVDRLHAAAGHRR